MSYIGNSPGVASQRVETAFTATSSQTVFTPSSGYTLGYCDVYQNGVKLVNGDDYTASDGATVTLATGAASGDSIVIVASFPRGLSDGYLKSEADAKYVALTGDQTVAGVKTLSSNPILSGGTANGVAYLNGSKVVTSGSALTFDGSSLGVGATLSSWRSGGGVIELNAATNGYVAINGGGGGLLQNAYINSSSAAIYKNTGTALYYTLSSAGEYTWNRAVSGSAGGTITWVPSMTLNASGYLGIGDTTPSYPLEIGSSVSATAPMLAVNPQTATNAAVMLLNNGGPGSLYIGRTSSTGTGAAAATLPAGGAGFIWCDGAQPFIIGTNNTEAARFDSGGNLVIGGTSASDKLTVKWAQTSNSFGYFSNTSDGNTGVRIQNSGRDFGIFVNGGGGSNNYLRFYDWTAGADRMIISSGGGVSIGTSSVYGTGTPLTGQFGAIGAVSTNPSAIVWGVYGSGGGMPQFCGNWASSNSWGIGPHSSSNDNIVRIGQISISGSGVAWNGSYSNVYAGAYTNASDYRIKKDVAELPAVLAKVLALRPITYCSIHIPDEDGDVIPDRTEVGFIAHEVQVLFPEVVSGEKDEVDPSGRPQHQGLEYAKMVTILTKAIQEQQAIIEQLQADVATLKGTP